MFFRLVVWVLYPGANPKLSLHDMRCFILKRLADCSHVLYKKAWNCDLFHADPCQMSGWYEYFNALIKSNLWLFQRTSCLAAALVACFIILLHPLSVSCIVVTVNSCHQRLCLAATIMWIFWFACPRIHKYAQWCRPGDLEQQQVQWWQVLKTVAMLEGLQLVDHLPQMSLWLEDWVKVGALYGSIAVMFLVY